MIKKFLLVLTVLILFSTFASGDYLALKNGKIYRIEGSFTIKDNNVVFKIKGNDLEITIPVDQVDLEKTKKLNESQKEQPKKNKEPIVISNQNLENLPARNETETEVTDEAAAVTQPNPEDELLNIPDYSINMVSDKDKEWWISEVEYVQNRLVQAFNFQRSTINRYNEMVIEANSKTNPTEKQQLLTEVANQGVKVKQSKDLLKDWYEAVKELYESGQESGIQLWILEPLRITIEQNKTAFETET